MGFEKVILSNDDTDHVVFLCKQCHSTLKIQKLKTLTIKDSKGKDKCTFIFLSCLKCKTPEYSQPKIKFYWGNRLYPRIEGSAKAKVGLPIIWDVELQKTIAKD